MRCPGASSGGPWRGATAAIAGIPPLAGFFSKLYIFLAAVDAELFTLAIVGVLSSVVAAYYYLRIVKLMYFDEPTADAAAPSQERAGVHALLAANGGAVLLLGIVPGGLMTLCSIAILRTLAT